MQSSTEHSNTFLWLRACLNMKYCQLFVFCGYGALQAHRQVFMPGPLLGKATPNAMYLGSRWHYKPCLHKIEIQHRQDAMWCGYQGPRGIWKSRPPRLLKQICFNSNVYSSGIAALEMKDIPETAIKWTATHTVQHSPGELWVRIVAFDHNSGRRRYVANSVVVRYCKIAPFGTELG